MTWLSRVAALRVRLLEWLNETTIEVVASEDPPPDHGDLLRAAVASIGEAAATLDGLGLATIDEADFEAGR